MKKNTTNNNQHSPRDNKAVVCLLHRAASFV